MGSKQLHVVCMGLGLLGFIAAVITCAAPSWRVSYHYIQPIRKELHVGLWMECLYQSTGENVCKVYNSLPAVSDETHAARALTILCCVVALTSLLALYTAYIKNNNPKRCVGVAMSLAGLMLLIPVSLAASQMWGNKWPGLCIFMGFTGGVLLLLAGVLLCCCSHCCSESPPNATTTTTAVAMSQLQLS
ncbi:claudin-4-like [Clarias gariepinus]|uniref:claudin-4-like n=1 Tax=Clarias gariepinus TaxID=13013 RepID=UPI00234DBC13|nr:claudin-4-like [Clarias gariepinus]